jgi:hypothetical protein
MATDEKRFISKNSVFHPAMISRRACQDPYMNHVIINLFMVSVNTLNYCLSLSIIDPHFNGRGSNLLPITVQFNRYDKYKSM